MERAIQIFAVINFGVIGLSHLVQPKPWVEFFLWLRERGRAGVFAVGYMSLMFGSIVVVFHNVWQGIPLVLTLIGWAQVIKALVYFVFPSFGLRRLELVSPERAALFRIAGVVFIALAGLLLFHLVGSA